MTSDPFADTELEVPRNYLRACILLLLAEEAGYGYELSSHLPDLGADSKSLHRGGTYRVLRQLEQDGLVLSHWDHSESGPPRRVYTITGEGLEWLHRTVSSVEHMRRGMTRFLRLYRGVSGES